MRVLLLVTGQALEELSRAGLGDGAQMRDGLLARHADAVIAHRQGSGFRIEFNPNAQFRLTAQQIRLRERHEPQFIVGIRGIGDQLTQEDLPVAVQ